MIKKIKNIIKYKRKGLCIGGLLVLFLIMIGIFLSDIGNYEKSYAQEPPLALMDPDASNSYDNPYLIKGVLDLYSLQEFTKYNTCEGMYFRVSPELKDAPSEDLLYYVEDEDEEDEEGIEGEGLQYHVDLIDNLDPKSKGIEQTDEVWYGLGMNYCYPFMGNIDFQGITLRTDTNIFGFLSDGAVVRGLRVFGDISSAKNNSYYNVNSSPIGGIASVAYITDPEGNNNSVTVTNCYVTNATISGNLSNEYGSVGGIIGLCYGSNRNYGSKPDKAVNFIIETCVVNADITCKGHYNFDTNSGTLLGSNSKNGVDKNGVFDKNNITNANTGAIYRGFAGGLIGEVRTFNSGYYANVHIQGDNQVYGNIKSISSASGAAIGSVYNKVSVSFTGSLSLKNSNEKLSSLLNRTAPKGENCHSGLLVGTCNYGKITIDKDKNNKEFVFVNNEEDLEGIPYIGNTASGGVPANAYIYPNFDSVKINGLGTDESPYELSSKDDFVKFALFLSSNGMFGEEYFDLSEKGSLTALNYVRSAVFEITEDIDISGTGINTLNRNDGQAFGGKFIGRIKGDGTKPLITFNIDTYQDDTCLFNYVFPTAGKQTVFKDFDITGNIKSRGRVDGLIYLLKIDQNGYNGDFIMENIHNSINLSSHYDIGGAAYNSPFIGQISAKGSYKDLSTEGGVQTQYVPQIKLDRLSYSGDCHVYNGRFGVIAAQIETTQNKYGYNNIIEISNIDITGNIICNTVSVNNNNVGGMLGIISSSNTTNRVTFPAQLTGQTFDIGNAGYQGVNSIIKVNNVNFHEFNMKVVNNVEMSLGGLLAYSSGNTYFNVDGISVKDCKVDYYSGNFGGLVYSISGENNYFKNINYDNYTIKQRKLGNSTFVGGMFGANNWGSGLINVENYNVENCTIIGNSRFSDFYGLNTGADTGRANYYDFCIMVNLIGKDENGVGYSATNPYTHKFAYKSSESAERIENYKKYETYSRLMYNMFSSDEFNVNGSSDFDDYIIHGSGDKDDPFIIDSPEKMMVLQLISLNFYGNRGNCIKYFDSFKLEYFSNTTIDYQKLLFVQKLYTGYYIFADDINMHDYSFSAIAANGGKYYGFNAKEYLTDKGIAVTEENLAQIYADAIDVLSRDEKIINAYEKAFANEYNLFLIEMGVGYDFKKEDKSIIAARVETKNSDVHNEYVKLMEYLDYKPVITLDAESIDNSPKIQEGYTYLHTHGLTSSSERYVRQLQARYLHMSLFTNINYCKGERAVEINNIALEGSFSSVPISNDKNNGRTGGALISKGNMSAITYSDVDIRNIEIGDVDVYKMGYAEKNYGTGLLIDVITASNVNLYGISVRPGATISADALIGYQTHDSSKTVFEHIDLNAAKDQLTYGLFYYNYDAGLAIYWYDDGDYEAEKINTDIVTPGIDNIESEKRVIDLPHIDDETYVYAYKRSKIEINPITAHIIHGNGTKDDPFVISNIAQLTSLQLAFKGLGQIAGDTEWFVGEIKDNPNFDPDDSETWELNGAHNYVTWKQTDTETDRKGKLEYLRSAYYVITEDIDLHNIPQEYEKYSIAADGFLGLGIESFPFSGSIDGSYSYDESTNTLSKKAINSTIILNTYPGNEAYQYGLVRYANGVNISNLNITSPKDDEGNYLPVTMAYTDARYGMAIAVVTGGDNVIDNVTASGLVYLATLTTSNALNQNSAIGGLVGYVMAGTLTFTNMDKEAVKDFTAMGYRESTNYIFKPGFAAGYVGYVYGTGVVFIEGDETYLDSSVNTYEDLPEEIYVSAANYAAVRKSCGYFINKNYLNEVLNDKIVVTGSAAEGFVCNLDNEKHMYILTLALRCGALSVNTTYYQNINDTVYYPYGYYSRTYKVNGDDFVAAYNPAIFEYFDFTGVSASYDKQGRLYTFDDSGIGATMYLSDINSQNAKGFTMLNQISSNTINNVDGRFRTTYTLKENAYYDMTKIPDFSGFGTRESLSNQALTLVYTFSSNFDGRGSTIYYEYGLPTSTINSRTGLFNGYFSSDIVQTSSDYALEFKNFTISGKVETRNLDPNTNTSAAVGAVIGQMVSKQYIDIYDVTVKDFMVTTSGYKNYVGALIGSNAYTSSYGSTSHINDAIRVYNVQIGDDVTEGSPEYNGKKYSIFIDGSNSYLSAGGVFGYTVQTDIKDVNVKNICIVGNESSNVGGLIGNFGMYGRFNYLENIIVENSVLKIQKGNVGGVLGRIGRSITNHTPSLSANNIISKNNDIVAVSKDSDVNTFEGKLVGYQGGTMEAGFVDVHTEYSDDFTGNIPIKVWNKFTAGDEKSEYFYINQLADIESVEKKYGIEGVSQEDVTLRDGTVRYADLIATNALVESGEKAYIFTDADGNPLDLIPDNDRVDDYLLVEWVTDAGTLEQVLNSVLDTLTNGTGKLNEPHEDASGNTNENISVEVVPMQVSHGVVSVGTHTPSVSITKNSAGKFIVTNNNIYDRVEKTNSKGEYTPGTYSLIRITYEVSVEATKNNVGYSRTIEIPLMVSNMINTDAYYRVELGENFDQNYLHNLTNRTLTLTRDSSYTVYNEILYSNNRVLFVDEEVYYVKEFVLDPKKPVIPKGTKLTLIDATDGISKIYYYEVTDYKTSVRLTEFTDEDGNHYVERDISDPTQLKTNATYRAMAVSNRTTLKKKYAVEKYIVFVDNTELEKVDNITGEESVWKPGIVNAGGFTSEDLNDKIGVDTDKIILTEDVFYEKNRCSTTLNTYNGRNIGFVEGSLVTTGTINKESNLKIDVAFFNEASTTYWDYINNKYTMELNDYANNEKYLEVSLNLVNEDGDRVLFPQGTKVKYMVTNQLDGIRSTSHVYYYKDAGTDGYLLMALTENTIENVSVEFDFSSAKMENLPAGNYSVELQLLRTGNKDFPMGSEVLDVITTDAITVTESVEYGFGISGYDKAKLSYNKKQETDSFVLDYNINLNSNYAVDLTQSKSVRIEYKLLMKNENTGMYEEYKPVDNAYATIDFGDLSKLDYRVVKNNDVIYSGEKGIIDISNTSKIVTENSQWIEITDIPGLGEDDLTIPFRLILPNNAKAVNYKVVATLYSGEGNIRESDDIVIFNISDIDI